MGDDVAATVVLDYLIFHLDGQHAERQNSAPGRDRGPLPCASDRWLGS